MLSLCLGACASLSEDECRNGDWQNIGYLDGVQGEGPEKLAEHREACTRYGIAPDLAAYSAGRDAGLQLFCTPRNGFRYGSRGSIYQGVCPANLELAFIGAYEQGHELHTHELAVSEINREVDEVERRLRDVDDDLYRIDTRLRDTDISDSERNQLYRRGQQLAQERGRLLADRDHLIGESRYRETKLFDFRRQLQQHPRYDDWMRDET